jgi:iron complex outermembrane receptor protein
MVQEREYDLPGGDAATTLAQFARTSGNQIAYLVENVRGERTQPVRGKYAAIEALRQMLTGTALFAVQDETTGAIVVSRKRTEGTERLGAATAGSSGSAAAGLPPGLTESPPSPPKAPTPLKTRNLLTLLTAWLIAGAADAADVAPGSTATAKESEVVKLETFNVSGSHIKGASTFTSPTPVLVVTYENLMAVAPVNLAEGLKQLPSIAPGGGQTVGGGTGNNSANFLNLRALGITRTLTLLDGRRFTPSGPTGQVDANLIPQGLVDRVDVVNGGASAAYGSDAVGGVVNFVLNKEFTGFKSDVVWGQSQRGDNQEYKAAVTYGTDYLKGRGHLVFSGEYAVSKGVNGDARDFRRREMNQIPEPGNTAKVVRASDIRSPFTTGGHIVNGVGGTAANNALIRGIKFGPGGGQSPYDYGQLSTTVGATNGFQSGGDGFRIGTAQEIVRPLTRKNLFLRSDFKLFEHLTLFVEGSYSETQMDVQNSPTTHLLTIRRDNAYLAQVAPDLVTRMTALGVTSFTMNRLTLEAGLTESHVNDQNRRVLMGLNARLGDWNWETSFQWGRNDISIPITNNLITGRMAVAADAVLVGGQIVPRALAANPGAVAFNPFGAGAPSRAALEYVMGTTQFDETSSQDVADTKISGDLLALPAGPLAVAAGAQWRSLQSTTRVDALSVANGYRLANNQPFSGDYTIMEEFLEAQVPVVRDLPLVKRLTASLAARHTDYSTSGDANTWKVGLVWQINSDLRVRASRSRDIRAPNLNELFSTGRQTNANISDNFPGGTGLTFQAVPNLAIGNLDLKPEVANSVVVGLVFQPAWLKGASFAVDFYTTKISDAIFVAGGQNAVRECDLNPASPLCAFVLRGPTAASPRAVIRTITSSVNLNSELSRGVDFEASYRVPLNTWFANLRPGSLAVRAIAGYIDEYTRVSPLAPTINFAGNGLANAASGTSAMPHIRGTLALNHSRNAVSTFLQMRYIGRMTWDKTRILGVTTDYNAVPSTAYFDGQIAYRLPRKGRHWQTEIYLNIANLLDRDPTYAPRTGGATPLPTDPGLFDQVGRMFRVGVKTLF